MLKEIQQKKKIEIAVKDFYADWCAPCKMQEPIIEELKKKYTQVNFEKIDIDKNENEKERFEIDAIPTIIIQKNGIIVKRFTGVTSKKVIEKELDNILLSNKKNFE